MKIWLAPLHGITYHGFRNLLVKHAAGIDAVIAPFIPVQPASHLNVKKWEDLFPENNPVLPVVPQLMGQNPDHFVDTARALLDMGYNTVNWNLGCPMPQIAKKKRGCGLLPYPDLIENTLQAFTRAQLPVNLSVKIRLGWQQPTEARELLNRLNSYPINFVIVHPRTGIQRYDGDIDIEEFEYLQTVSVHPLIYNGDICTPQQFQALSVRFPLQQEWMIGRGLLQNPFLAEQIKKGETHNSNTREKYRQRYVSFYLECVEMLQNQYGERRALCALKELSYYFSTYWNIDTENLAKMLRINDFFCFSHKLFLYFCNP
ncbi:MAG: tRNA-dihydrouridine synthase family protein [Bacteroidales bacterium]|jgi:tRNA-dihydrouridine synthase|nr:tRNA-dihydrouridine synthase family protein [Bacteroidales bacterium]